jgi:hypothetical protein
MQGHHLQQSAEHRDAFSNVRLSRKRRLCQAYTLQRVTLMGPLRICHGNWANVPMRERRLRVNFGRRGA